MRVRFYIEKRKGADGRLLTIRRPIFMTVAFNGIRVLISTQHFIDLKWWDSEKQRVRTVYPEAFLINNWLDSLKYTAGIVWKSLASLSENPGAAEFRSAFEKLRPRFSGGFFDVMFLFMEEGNQRWSSGTYQKVRTFYKQLKQFEKEAAYTVSFDTVNEEFLYRFQEFQQKAGKGAVTIMKMINTLVWFLNWASDEGYNVYSDYRKFYRNLDAPEKEEKSEGVFLHWEELLKLLNYRSEEPKIQRVRDVFCLQCLTGISFGELKSLQKTDIDEKFLHVRKKNGITRHVPLNKYSAGILQQYKNKFYRNNSALPQMSLVTLNKYLRQLGEEAHLLRETEEPGNSGKMLPVYQVLSSGVAGRTFIYNALRLGIGPEIIASYTGIRNDQRIKILQQELSNKEMDKFNSI